PELVVKWRIFCKKDRVSNLVFLSSHSSCENHFELSFCFSILYLSLPNILTHWQFPFF
uniref:Uncharacterized protein n=1 Tax=Amphimedon queenslandica TaxID=400682 RepID=A0A1X7USN1_AMPQE